MINICVPVLKRYDLLHGLFLSLKKSRVQPDKLWIIDNGQHTERLLAAVDAETFPVHAHRPSRPMGVAESWNWFIKNVPEDRIIANDDIIFAPDSLAKMQARKVPVCCTCRGSNVERDKEQEHPGVGSCQDCNKECYIDDVPPDLLWASGFSCFMIRDACVEKIGLFDETISPGYGYYEDEDYLQRLDGRGTKPRAATAENVNCGIIHLKSQTLVASTHEEILEHHRKFKVAQANYIKKWHLEEVFK